MFFLSDYQSIRFKRGKDKKKRKSKVGSMMIPAIPGGAAIGMLPVAGYTALQIVRKKPVNMKTLGYTLGAGIGTGAIGGAIAGDRLDKRMKTGQYES